MAIACAEQLGIITVKCVRGRSFAFLIFSRRSFFPFSDALSSVPARNAYVKVYIKLKNGSIEFYKVM